MLSTSSIELSSEQQYAVDASVSGANLLILGKAGVGKSTMLNVLQFKLSELGIPFVVLAPTGVAALNVGGMTVHKFMQLLERRKLSPSAANFTTMLIDEASMLRADLFDELDLALRKYFYQSDLPFAGRQVILIGDPGQLPPVVNSRTEPEIAQTLQQNYFSPFFFSSFAYSQGAFVHVELTKIFRQDSERYAKLLNLIRSGNSDITVKYLNSAHIKPEPSGIVLTSTNQLAAQLNASELAKLKTPTTTNHALLWASSTEHAFKDSEMPNDSRLELKVGAQVMIIKNIYRDSETGEHPDWDSSSSYDRLAMVLCNGDVGVVESLENIKDGEVTIDVARLNNSFTIHLTTDGTWFKYALLGYEEATISSSSGHKVKVASKAKKEPVASFTQFPFRLAYAITIHKSQGATISTPFTVDLRRPMFAEGQLYVALSRGTSLENLSILGKVRESDVKVSPAVTDFLKNFNYSKYVGVKAGSKFANLLQAFKDIEAEENKPQNVAKRQAETAKVINLLDSFTDPLENPDLPEPPKAA
jgi:ATP-dependent exoDNAse (exonuclease V) alpha subunit